jgi:tetratricopeptide (TPR) repeat protein
MQENTEQADIANGNWSTTQTYAMAAVCLVIGLLVGFLVRGSNTSVRHAASTDAQMQPAASTPSGGMGQQPMPTMDDMKRMADRQAQPLLAKLKTAPKDPSLLNKTGLTYKAAHQFKEAIPYFQKALEIDPKNVAIRDDMASCMYYTGDVDGALRELNKSLAYDPRHPGTLMNIGIIEWQGKNNVKDAVTSWEKLLKLNPNFPQREMIEHLITQAKQQQNTADSATQPKG